MNAAAGAGFDREPSVAEVPSGDRQELRGVRAGEGEGAVGEREDEAAVADPVTVHHVRADPHRDARAARTAGIERHPELPRGRVAAPERLCRAVGRALPFLVVPVWLIPAHTCV